MAIGKEFDPLAWTEEGVEPPATLKSVISDQKAVDRYQIRIEDTTSFTPLWKIKFYILKDVLSYCVLFGPSKFS